MISEYMASVKINDIRQEDETLIFDPYNPLNREITEEEVCKILKNFGIPNPKVNNMNLYRRAFVHKSYVKKPEQENEEKGIIIAPKPSDCIELKKKSNDRLEFVGDGVLECITKLYLYERFPKNDEGFMTDTKIALVKNDAIGQLALDIGLHKWYIISKNAEQKNTRTNVKKLGNLFEAFLGAVFLDSNKIEILDEHGWFRNLFMTGPGFQMAQIFLVNIFERPGLVPWHKIIETNENYKNQLQVMIQKEFKTVPHYFEIPLEDTDTGGFRMAVFLCLGMQPHTIQTQYSNAISLLQIQQQCEKGELWSYIHDYTVKHSGRILVKLGEGYNKIKKKAEQIACKEALNILQEGLMNGV
jgi:dsRNA-specific ribonuclease